MEAQTVTTRAHPSPRLEDDPLVRGSGRFAADVPLPGQTHAYFVRSPHAFADVRSIDTAAARAVPGVLAVHNPDWRSGMGSSLAAGLAMVPERCAAAVIALVDQPLVGAEAVRRLIAAHAAGAGIAVSNAGSGPSSRRVAGFGMTGFGSDVLSIWPLSSARA